MQNELKQAFQTFFSISSDAQTAGIAFIETCIFPRMLASPMDALFCAEFIRCLVRWKIPNYDHLACMKHVIQLAIPFLRGCTPVEASNMGVFVLEGMKDMKRWAHSERAFRECVNNPVFRFEGKEKISLKEYNQVGVVFFEMEIDDDYMIT